jgi:probable rRNA maturation factor
MPTFVSVRRGRSRGISSKTVRGWADRMLERLGLTETELSVVLTDDEEIHELNQVFRRRDTPTDVLAFAMREEQAAGPKRGRSKSARRASDSPAPGELLGDIVVSVETARRQAERRGRTLDSEICMLLAHGLLHLVGYDHQTVREARVMGAKTRELCHVASRQPALRAGR